MRLISEMEAGDDYRSLIERELTIRLKLRRRRRRPRRRRRRIAAKAAATGTAAAAWTPRCASCATINDADAQFCKKCGAKLYPRPVAPVADRRAGLPWPQRRAADGGGGMPNLRAHRRRAAARSRACRRNGQRARRAQDARQCGRRCRGDSAVIRNAGGDMRKRTAKTDSERAGALRGARPAGDVLKAEVKVDGEELASDELHRPADGRYPDDADLWARRRRGLPARASGQSESLGVSRWEPRQGAPSPTPPSPRERWRCAPWTRPARPSRTTRSSWEWWAGQQGRRQERHHRCLGRGALRGPAHRRQHRLRRRRRMARDAPRHAPFAMPESGGARAEIRALGTHRRHDGDHDRPRRLASSC